MNILEIFGLVFIILITVTLVCQIIKMFVISTIKKKEQYMLSNLDKLIENGEINFTCKDANGKEEVVSSIQDKINEINQKDGKNNGKL